MMESHRNSDLWIQSPYSEAPTLSEYSGLWSSFSIADCVNKKCRNEREMEHHFLLALINEINLKMQFLFLFLDILSKQKALGWNLTPGYVLWPESNLPLSVVQD